MGYVYKITNTVNDKSYIGISIYEPEAGRINDHLSGRGNRVIANAVKKYGKDAFTYEILEENIFDEFLPDLEVAYIAKHNTIVPHGYNLTSGGEIAKIISAETRRKISEANKGKSKGEKNPFFGKVHSKETRKKISASRKGKLKGEKNPNFGKTFSEERRRKISEAKKNPSAETRRKMSEAKKGKPLSEEHRRKLSEVRKGKKHSMESRSKMSEVKKGEKHNFYGKKHSKESRRKMSEAQKGRKHSEKTKRKMSEAQKHPDYEQAYSYFLSLSPEISLREKRRLMYSKFANVHGGTIRKWVQKWTSTT